MVARLDIDRHGFVVGRKLMAAVIRLRARFDYAGVATVLFGQPSSQHDQYLPFCPSASAAARWRDDCRRSAIVEAVSTICPEAKVIFGCRRSAPGGDGGSAREPMRLRCDARIR